MSFDDSLTPRYLLYRVLEPLGPYIAGTWEVRESLSIPLVGSLGSGSLRFGPGGRVARALYRFRVSGFIRVRGLGFRVWWLVL